MTIELFMENVKKTKPKEFTDALALKLCEAASVEAASLDFVELLLEFGYSEEELCTMVVVLGLMLVMQEARACQ